MTRWENYLSSAEKIIGNYDGNVPLHHYLKAYFKQHPNMGSRDRRQVSQLVYHYYRLGQWAADAPVKDRIIAGTFLCDSQPNDFLAFFQPDLNNLITASLPEKLQQVTLSGTHPTAGAIFPFTAHLSEGIDPEAFALAGLQQPYLFIRVRNVPKARVTRLLDAAQVSYTTTEGSDTIMLPNSTKIETILPERAWYEVQDLSSQQTGALLHPRKQEYWWDCCAASGGKSMLLKDAEPSVHLLATDVRNSILDNLKKRFTTAVIKDYQTKVVDLNQPVPAAVINNRKFDGIILDAPCSGSGTWGRTPENLAFFTADKIAHFQQLQKRIAMNVIPHLKPGGSFIYITCSVFKEENEEVIGYIEENSQLRRQQGGVIAGYGKGADTMFAVRMG